MFCPDAPDITLKPGDWVMVSKNPPVPNSVRKQPGIGSELSGQIQPGENALVEDGPRCADGYAWWYVRSLKDLEGWTVEGDTASYWLVNPISAWYSLPEPLVARGAQKQQLREISISPDTALVHAINGQYYPLATPLPTPRTIETPFPNDPRGGIEDLQAPAHSAHSSYQISGVIDGSIDIYELEDPLSRYYLNNMSHDDCTQALRDILERDEITPAYLDPFCGVGIGIPLHFIADIRPIDFSGGKGVRFLISSGNYQTVNELYYIFQGLSDDGRYYIRIRFSHIVHPYIIEPQQLSNDFGPVLGWKSGQYEEAQKSYDEFNARIGDLLNAGVVTLYPSLTFLDDAIASMIIN